MIITFMREDILFAERPFEELSWRIEAAVDCDGGICRGPMTPDDSLTPHWHLVGSDVGLNRSRYVYVDPTTQNN